MAEPNPTTIITRSEAKALGLTRYFTGKPCKHGHITTRSTKTDKCKECQKLIPNGEKNRIQDRFRYAVNKNGRKDKRKITDSIYYQTHQKEFIVRKQKWRHANAHFYPLNNARNRSKHRNWKFDLTQKWARENWTGVCALTGLPFVKSKSLANPFSPSIDKIKPELGYIQTNCRFVLHGVNCLKGLGTDEDVLKIARAIVAKFGA